MTDSKLKQAMQILKHIPEPTTHQIIDISENLKCSERWVWEALKRLRENVQKQAEEFSLVKELTSDALFIQEIMLTKMSLKGNITINEKRRLNAIGKRLEKLELELEMDNYESLLEGIQE